MLSAVQADRVYIFGDQAVPDDPASMQKIMEFDAPAVRPLSGNPLIGAGAHLLQQSYQAALLSGEYLRITVQETGEVVMSMKKRHASSMLILPVRSGRTVWGFMGIESGGEIRDWQPEEMALLQAVAAMLSLAVERQQTHRDHLQLARALEQAAEAVFITDTSGTIEYVNPAFERQTGYAKEEAVGMNPRVLNAGIVEPEIYQDMWNRLSQGETWSGHFVNRHRDGALFKWASTISPMLDSEDRITSYVAVCRDITRESQLEEQLRQSQKMDAVGRLASGISHDFNNLMSAILVHTDALLDDMGPDHELQSEIQIIRQVAERGADLTRQLLAFGKRQMLNPRIIDLNDVVQNISRMLRRVLSENITLETRLAGQSALVQADPIQVTQVGMNLAINARDAMPRGGRLLIETGRRMLSATEAEECGAPVAGAYVMLRVTDDGVGMNEETRRHVFEPFFTTKESRKGTGLGLSTVYGIVSQSKGFIQIESAPEQGAIFSVFLPASEDDADVEPEDEPAVSAATAAHGETILVVEDDRMVRELAARVLRRHGYHVLDAPHAEAALAQIKAYDGIIDLVLTDSIMPGMNGREMAQRIQHLCPETRIMYMSGHPDETLAPLGFLDDGLRFIKKPFTMDFLVQCVYDALNGTDSLQYGSE
jgi:PAS domain S-box-containing protein